MVSSFVLYLRFSSTSRQIKRREGEEERRSPISLAKVRFRGVHTSSSLFGRLCTKLVYKAATVFRE